MSAHLLFWVVIVIQVLAAGAVAIVELTNRKYRRNIKTLETMIDTLVNPFAGLKLSEDERRYLALQARHAARRVQDQHHTPELARRWDMIANALDPGSDVASAQEEGQSKT